VRAASAAALAVALIGILCAGLWLGGHPNELPLPLRNLFVDESTTLSGEAAETIEDSYFRPVSRGELSDASLRGMVATLRRRYKDRYSHYFDPEQAQAFDEETQGRFAGIGLSVVEAKRGLKVADVFKHSPAVRAGIKAGDVIVSVDGESIAGQPADLSTAKIKGPAGTKVRLGVRQASTGQVRRLTVKRAEITEPVVEWRQRRIGGLALGYVRLIRFSAGAHGRLRHAVKALIGRGSRGIVLDLRRNPGGLLPEAILTASVFLAKGQKVVTTASRSEGRHVYRATGDPLPRRPMVVLIDHDTASAAEILASALADHGFARVVGTRSFGKGVFQHVIGLSNGGELDLTVGRYFTANGVSLAPKGIRPDVRAHDRPGTKPDEALQRALGVLADEVRAEGNRKAEQQGPGTEDGSQKQGAGSSAWR
jgi:carboxyl-terminal processing protease